MLNAILLGFRLIILVLSGQKQVALENAAMRQQLGVFKRNVKRPRLSVWDRLFWNGADDDLERLEVRSCYRAAGNGNRMAAQTVQTILVAVVSAKRTGATAPGFGDSASGPKHGCGQPNLGGTAHTRRTLKTRIRDLGANRFTTNAEKGQEAFANVENVSAQSCRPTRFGGFLHRRDDSITRAVCFCVAGARPSSCSPFQCRRTPNRDLGCTTNR